MCPGFFWFITQKVQLSEFELGIVVCLVQPDGSAELDHRLLEIRLTSEFQIGQCQTVVSIGVLRIQLRDILVLENGLLILALLEIARGPCFMSGLLGLGLILGTAF